MAKLNFQHHYFSLDPSEKKNGGGGLSCDTQQPQQHLSFILKNVFDTFHDI